ncbi:MAG: GAF domain-containing protein [Sandaracinaceae bacterium]|nr:GAF domain-containing protein [Sandaracinaceae bacterium]
MNDGRDKATQKVEPDRLRFLTSITKMLAEATTEYERVLDMIVEQTARFLDASVVLGLLSADRASWLPMAQFTEDVVVQRALQRLLERGGIPINQALLARFAARIGQPTVAHAPFPDALRSSMNADVLATFEQIGTRSIALTPLGVVGEVLGTLTVLRVGEDARPFDDEDLDLLRGLAGHASQAIANARLVDAMRRELDEHARTRKALAASEAKALQLQRMEAIGRLAGSVAHDFNNLLSVISSYADMVHDELPEDDERRAATEEIMIASRRAAEVTRQLLAFSRQQVLQPQEIALNRVVVGLEKMLQRLLGEDIDVRTRLARDLLPCKVDASQMEQVLLQLVINARDAMPFGGRLTIETSNVHIDEAYVAEHPEATVGPHVMLSVTDSGFGMDADTVHRIFEPFTPKLASPRSGLGLSSVYGIVRQSGGSIAVESAVGKGTTMRVYLPRIEPSPSSRRGGVASLPLPSAERVLVVQPDRHLANLLRELLERANYGVHVVADEGEAILLAQQRTTHIDLLLCDLDALRMRVASFSQRLRQAWPELRTLGLASFVVSSSDVSPDIGAHVLAKPITPDALLKGVQDLFEA